MRRTTSCSTRSRSVAPFLILGLLGLAASPAVAQVHRSAIGVTGGWSTHGDLTPGTGSETVLESGWTAGVQLERWMGAGRVGLRLNGAYAERPVEAVATYNEYNVYHGDVSMLVRLLPVQAGRAVAPFVSLGLGASHYNGVGPSGSIGGGTFGDDPATRALAVAGLGVDFSSSGQLGLRVEATDQIVLVGIGEGPAAEGFPMTHNLQLSTALQLRVGRLTREPVRRGAETVPAPAAPPVPPSPSVGPTAEDAVIRQVAGPASSPDHDRDNGRVRELEARLAEGQRALADLEIRVNSLEREIVTLRESASGSAPRVATSAQASAAVAGRHTVQVGSFIEPATAREWAERLRQSGLPVWMETVFVEGREMNRVRGGLVESLRDAHALAVLLKRDGWPVWVAPVTAGEEPPADGLQATRAYLTNR